MEAAEILLIGQMDEAANRKVIIIVDLNEASINWEAKTYRSN